jgi:4-hydroxy-3-polyprenylbenzoate decarboxylase
MTTSFPQNKSPIVLAVCGASGQIYARWVLKLLLKHTDLSICLIMSRSAGQVLHDELGVGDLAEGLDEGRDRIFVCNDNQMDHELASGSVRTQGMIICPCSLNTLAGLAGGLSDNLIKRASQVHLKQRRKLVVAVREMPLGLIDLENMVRLTQAGAIVTPISPAFYHCPRDIDALVEFAARKLVELVVEIPGGYEYHP